MKITTKFLPHPLDFKSYAEKHNLEVEIVERSQDNVTKDCSRFYAQLVDADMQEGCCTTPCFGNGDSPQLALDALCRRISKQTVHILCRRISEQTVHITTAGAQVGAVKVHSNMRTLNVPDLKSFTLSKQLSVRQPD